jgi:precorrin-4/cobalt-precorrin-4 C11-methyltransferase
MVVHFVGAGPGAADLLTVRATRLLAEADVVLYPGTYLDAGVLGHVGPQATLVDTQDLDLDQITERLVVAHRAGRDAVRLASGDLSLYSALAEQTRRLDAAGVPWDVTPGVPAYAAAAAVVGRELTVPLLAQSVVLTRAQARSTAMPETESLAAFAATRATLVLHLAITRTRQLMAELEPAYGADCPVVVVYRASQPGELVLRATIASVADAVETAGLRQAAVILVGRALDPRPGGESYLYDAGRDRSGKRSAPRVGPLGDGAGRRPAGE